ncbi:MAG: hypothetical protein ACI9M9_002399 [Flavobacteriaceae bacterium]|jgi:hypothetical protein
MLALDSLFGINEVNPLLSAKGNPQRKLWVFCFLRKREVYFNFRAENKKQTVVDGLGFYACIG